MQKKNDNFLGRIVKKDYNNNLEKVLSKKDFSEEVKNTLLSMFYKIENGYNDYNVIKRETFDKKEYIEKLINIIEKDCDKIEFVSKRNLEQVDKDKKEIKCLPIEARILYSLAKIQKRNIVVKYVDKSIEEAFSTMLNTGNNINIVEPLRDFNGFSWNIIVKDIEDLNYNLMYQNMIFLVGNKFVDKWVNNYESLVDYFDLFQNEIDKKYGKKSKENITTNLITLSIKLKSLYDSDFKKEIENKKEEIKQEKDKLENREFYLVNISKHKKQKESEIKILDKIINDKNLLIKEYERRNEKLPLEKKIFSIRVLKNKLKEEREQILQEINKCNRLMNPKEFLEQRNIIENKYKYLKMIENLEIKEDLINLQNEIIKCMYLDIKNVKEKNNLINDIYKYRYYNLLPIEDKKYIYEENRLKKSLDKLTKILINKAIEMKIISKISENEQVNYNIIGNLLLTKIIELQDINIKFSNEKDKIYLTIYDEEIEESKIELKNIAKEEIKIKFNKKTKLFI